MEKYTYYLQLLLNLITQINHRVVAAMNTFFYSQTFVSITNVIGILR